MERVGDTVRRPLHPWSGSVHELLLHLESIGFPHSPRFLGIDEDGREVLTYLDGESGGDGWHAVIPDAGLRAMARLLRSYHDTIRGFHPAARAGWAESSAAPRPGELICHGDFGPWNLVWHGTEPIGILDWDYAWPQPPIHDVAYALEYVAPFRDDRATVGWMRHPAVPDRRRRLELFAEAYGLTSADGLVDEVVAQQAAVLRRARALAARGLQPQLAWERSGVLDETAARLAWTRTHRHLFE